MPLSYIIYISEFDKNVGGVCAMHYLAECLHDLGVDEVYVTTSVTNPIWYAKKIDLDKPFFIQEGWYGRLYRFLAQVKGERIPMTFKRKITRTLLRMFPSLLWRFFDRNKTVVIYPEATKGNPLKAKHVVRWILNTPGVCGGDGIFEKTDHIFLYHDFYKVNPEYRVQGILTAIDLKTQLTKFIDKGLTDRKGGAFLVRKGFYKKLDQHPADFVKADEILEGGTYDEMAQFFNRIETFISYDHMTFISIQAALSGCKSIIIPDADGEFSKEHLIKVNRINGVAYGFEDQDWVEASKNNLRQHLVDLNEKNLETVRGFHEYCNLKIN
jgi:hypothetical protein